MVLLNNCTISCNSLGTAPAMAVGGRQSCRRGAMSHLRFATCVDGPPGVAAVNIRRGAHV